MLFIRVLFIKLFGLDQIYTQTGRETGRATEGKVRRTTGRANFARRTLPSVARRVYFRNVYTLKAYLVIHSSI